MHFSYFTKNNIQGKELDPDRITESLDLEAESCCKAGECFEYPRLKISTAKTGYWTYRSRLELNIDKQLTLFTEDFFEKKEVLIDIASWESIEEAYINEKTPLKQALTGNYYNLKEQQNYNQLSLFDL